jgi:hypothetical protein
MWEGRGMRPHSSRSLFVWACSPVMTLFLTNGTHTSTFSWWGHCAVRIRCTSSTSTRFWHWWQGTDGILVFKGTKRPYLFIEVPLTIGIQPTRWNNWWQLIYIGIPRVLKKVNFYFYGITSFCDKERPRRSWSGNTFWYLWSSFAVLSNLSSHMSEQWYYHPHGKPIGQSCNVWTY